MLFLYLSKGLHNLIKFPRHCVSPSELLHHQSREQLDVAAQSVFAKVLPPWLSLHAKLRWLLFISFTEMLWWWIHSCWPTTEWMLRPGLPVFPFKTAVPQAPASAITFYSGMQSPKSSVWPPNSPGVNILELVRPSHTSSFPEGHHTTVKSSCSSEHTIACLHSCLVIQFPESPRWCREPASSKKDIKLPQRCCWVTALLSTSPACIQRGSFNQAKRVLLGRQAVHLSCFSFPRIEIWNC